MNPCPAASGQLLPVTNKVRNGLDESSNTGDWSTLFSGTVKRRKIVDQQQRVFGFDVSWKDGFERVTTRGKKTSGGNPAATISLPICQGWIPEGLKQPRWFGL